jgi:CBS domain containing-hemolysin-like protein
VTEHAFRILLVCGLLALNGFFAGAEVALLSVRQSRLRQMAQEGHAGAQAALNLLANPGRLLSVTQVGVTLGSLGLGWAGEDGLFQFLVFLVHPWLTPASQRYLHALSFGLAFLTISYLHVVVGEVVPKNLAMAKADRMAALVAPALLAFRRVATPFVVAIERSAAAITRLLKIKNARGGHSAEELKLIVSSSRGLGYLPEMQEDMIHHILDLSSVLVREVMVSRNGIVSVPRAATLDEVLQTMIERQHSRLPVYDGTPERVIGLLHYKDLLPLWEERRRAISTGRPARPFRLDSLMRPVLVVPETKPVADMLEEFRVGRSHLAMVVDEFGTIAGMLTIEDVLELVVGPIEDEHDEKQAAHAAATGEVELDGATRIRDLESDYGIELPDEAGYETLAGFLLFRLRRIPRAGDAWEEQGRRFTVVAMERNRIARVRIVRLPASATPAAEVAPAR